MKKIISLMLVIALSLGCMMPGGVASAAIKEDTSDANIASVEALEYTTIGYAKYLMYVYTTLTGYVAEGSISFDIASYTTTDTTIRTNIKNATKKLSVSGNVTWINFSQNSYSGSKSVTGSSGQLTVQKTKSGSVAYGVTATGVFSCSNEYSNGSWTRNASQYITDNLTGG